MKTFQNWEGSGKDLSQFLDVGDVVNDAMKWYFIECMPPACMSGGVIQMGEPHDHGGPDGAERFLTLRREGGKWLYRGPMVQGGR